MLQTRKGNKANINPYFSLSRILFYAISCYVMFFDIKVANDMKPNEEKRSTNVTICAEDQIQMEISCKHHLNSFYCFYSPCGLNL